ncbi:hypothetical protein B0H14DRAFT_2650066 [Mycena olivaceomarginata]|nr:hypothetical protein B0H14DRAFT_2650066 [Mycena olivaceomarginata]
MIRYHTGMSDGVIGNCLLSVARPRQVAVLALKSFMFLSSSSPSPHLQALQIVPGPQAPNAARSVRVSPHQDISLGDVAHHICSTKAAWVHMDLSKFSSTVQAAPFVYRHDTDSARWLTRIREVIACATYHAHTTAHTLNSLAVPASVRDPSATNGPVAGPSTVSGSASSTHDDDDDDE